MKAAFLLLSLALVQEPNTLLRRTLRADSTDVYKIEDRIEQTVVSGMGTMPMTIVSNRTSTVKTMGVDKAAGVAQIETTTVVDKLTADGAAAALAVQKPAPSVQKGKIDVRGRITFDAIPSTEVLSGLMSGTQGAIAAGNFVEFPEKAVKIGERWEVIVPKDPLLYDRDQKLTETLTGEKESNGVPVWTVSVSGTLLTAIDGSKLSAGKTGTPLAAQIEGQDEISGEGLVEKSTGRTILMKLHGTSKRTIKLLDVGLTLQSSGKVDTKIELQKP